jgi:hypothetical protein
VQPIRLFAVCALAHASMSGVTLAQGLPEGRVYTFHSDAKAGCPSLDWHVVAGAHGTLSGMVAWNNMSTIAKATGSMNMQTRTFLMTAEEVGGQGRTATVEGTVRQDGWLFANIKGPDISCQSIAVPWFVLPASEGGSG